MSATCLRSRIPPLMRHKFTGPTNPSARTATGSVRTTSAAVRGRDACDTRDQVRCVGSDNQPVFEEAPPTTTFLMQLCGPPLPLSVCSFDPVCHLAVPTSVPSLEDHFQLESRRSKEMVRVQVLSGYLESDRYHVYCLGGRTSLPHSLSDLECQSILWSDTGGAAPQKGHTPDGLPSQEQLAIIFNRLSNDLPNFFVRTHDYTMYSKDVEFCNNIRGVTTRGLPAYVQQMATVKILSHLRYAHVKLEILKMTRHPEDGTVRVRWRIVGISGLRVLFFFWKFRVWEWSRMMTNEADWIDGFSVFHVGGDGLIYRHVCDKVIPDGERESKTTNVATKIALALGLVPRPPDAAAHFFNPPAAPPIPS